MKKILFLSAFWCLSLLAMKDKQQKASSNNKPTLAELLQNKKARTLASDEGCLLDEFLPEISEYIFPYYWDRSALDLEDKQKIDSLHDWYCEMRVEVRKKVCQESQGLLIPHEQCNEIWQLVNNLMGKYNVPVDANKIPSVALSDDLSNYLESRLARLETHKGQLCQAHAQSVDELHRWFHGLLEYQRVQTTRRERQSISSELYKNIIGSLKFLEKQAQLPSLKKPKYVLFKNEKFWEVFDAWPNFE